VKAATLSILLVAVVTAFGAHAQATGGARRAPLAAPEDLNPAVDVGGTRVAIAQRPEAPVPSAQPPAPSAPSDAAPAAPAPTRAQRTVTEPSPAVETSPRPRALDSIDLGTTSITGNQELPKVLYIVPWKKSDLGDLLGRPVNTLLDEVLAPVDPEVFERHLEYYESLYGKKGQEE
jgi:hypothetical protein